MHEANNLKTYTVSLLSSSAVYISIVIILPYKQPSTTT